MGVDGGVGGRTGQESLLLSLLYFLRLPPPLFSLTVVCKYLHVSVSFTLSLFKRRGKDTHPAAFAAAPDFSPPFLSGSFPSAFVLA